MTIASLGNFAMRLTWAAFFAVAVAACSRTSESTPTSVPPPPAAATPADAATSPDAEAGDAKVRVAFASTDLAVGPNRIAFGILRSGTMPIRVPEAKATFLYLDAGTAVARAQATARFFQWPQGRSGVYVANVSFDQAGRWGIVVEVTDEDGLARVGDAGFVVKQQSASPGIGGAVPASRNKTARDVTDLKEISTSRVPDPDLYQMTVAEAAASGRPTVVTFASPAFCTTATCGPQVEVIASIKDRHKGQANFIHVEVYHLKVEDGKHSKGQFSPLLREWGLLTEPFTFVLDNRGLVASKFEGFVTEEELEAALASALGS